MAAVAMAAPGPGGTLGKKTPRTTMVTTVPKGTPPTGNNLRIQIPPGFVPDSHVELRHQLVLWKKASFLLDNIAFTPGLCQKLVEYDIFTDDMMGVVMAKTFDIERKLMILALLGKHGTDVYEKFLKILEETNHHVVVKELRKTEKFIYYGEMLPPCFHYFLSMSEFLKTYPHIAMKLGEDEKHILQMFIEGKIDMANKVKDEHIKHLQHDKIQLNKMIQDLQNKLQRSKDRERALKEALDEANRRIELLKERAKVLETDNNHIREEIRRLKHFRVQQQELYHYLGDYAEKNKVESVDMGNYPRPQLDFSALGELAKEYTFLRQKTTIDENEAPGPLHRQNSSVNLNVRQNSKLNLGGRQGSRLSRQNTKMGMGSRQPTKVVPKFTNRESAMKKMQLTQQQVNVLANKMFYLQYNLIEWQNEEKIVHTAINKEGQDKSYIIEMKKILLEIKKEKKAIVEQLSQMDKEIFSKEKFIAEIKRDVMGFVATPGGDKIKHDSLVMNFHSILDHIHKQHKLQVEFQQKDLKQQERKHEAEIQKLMQHIQEINMQHVEECNRLKGRIRAKVYELHQREKLHKRMRRQIQVLENYQAENMNATVTIDQCRKIVRSIIGEARTLAAMAEEREDQKPFWEQWDAEKEKEDMEKKKKKQKKKKKKFDNLKNERLLYIGDRINVLWKDLGGHLGLTTNRLEMIEMDNPYAKGPDQMCMAMLKTWRDDEKGKVADLVEALKAMNRQDLAMVVMPMNSKRVEIIKAGQTDDDDDEDDEDDEDEKKSAVNVDDVNVEIASNRTSSKKGKKGGKKDKQLDNNKKNVPKLPKIKK